MDANDNVANGVMNAGPIIGVTGGITALAAMSQPEAKLSTCAVMFALAAGSALRKLLFAPPVAKALGDYPFDTRAALPWERDGGPHGL